MALRIATYNLYEGAKDSYHRLIDFVKEQDWDVLCLQEVNGWQDGDFAKLKQFQDWAGFMNYEYGNSRSDFKLATFSVPKVTSRVIHEEGFWHCALETHIEFAGQELVIVNLDLDPYQEEPRLAEIKKLLSNLDQTKPTILCGDFNSLSRSDNYDKSVFDGLAARDIYKYGRTQLEYGVTDYLLQAGFEDAAAKLGRAEPTSPSHYFEAAEPPVRTDYFFVSKDLISKVRSVAVIKTKQTDKLSDHYPLVLTLGEATAEIAVPDGLSATEESKLSTSGTEGEIDLH